MSGRLALGLGFVAAAGLSAAAVARAWSNLDLATPVVGAVSVAAGGGWCARPNVGRFADDLVRPIRGAAGGRAATGLGRAQQRGVARRGRGRRGASRARGRPADGGALDLRRLVAAFVPGVVRIGGRDRRVRAPKRSRTSRSWGRAAGRAPVR